MIDNHTPLPYGLRNPYRNLKSENSQDCAQKPQRNYMFTNSASGCVIVNILYGAVKLPSGFFPPLLTHNFCSYSALIFYFL
jgi:hypothetical protein